MQNKMLPYVRDHERVEVMFAPERGVESNVSSNWIFFEKNNIYSMNEWDMARESNKSWYSR